MQIGKEEEGPSSSPRKGEGGRLLKAKRGKGKRELERRRRMSLHHSLFPSFAPPAAAAKRRKGMQGNRRLGFDKGFFSVSIVGHNCFDRWTKSCSFYINTAKAALLADPSPIC